MSNKILYLPQNKIIRGDDTCKIKLTKTSGQPKKSQLSYNEYLQITMNNHIKWCEEQGKDVSFLRKFRPMKFRANEKKFNKWTFMCAHNKCGFLDQENCDYEGHDCCHKTWKVKVGSTYANVAFFKCFF